MTDTFGNLVHFKLTGGNEHDSPHAKALLSSINAERVIADKAYDSNELLTTIDQMGAGAVIPSKANRKQQRTLDVETYKRRNRIERFFSLLTDEDLRLIAAQHFAEVGFETVDPGDGHHGHFQALTLRRD